MIWLFIGNPAQSYRALPAKWDQTVLFAISSTFYLFLLLARTFFT